MRKLRMIGATIGALILATVAMASPAQADHEAVNVTSGPMQFGPNGFGGISCPEGTTVVKGGYTWPDGAEHLDVKLDEAMEPETVYPHYTTKPGETGWYVQNGETAQELTVWAECATEHTDEPTGEPTATPTTEPTAEPTTEPTSGPSASVPAAPSSPAPGAAGGLPVTGVAAGGIAVGAAVLLGVGGVLFLAARRRRVTFTP